MKIEIAAISMLMAFAGAVAACSASTTKRALWGLLSLSLGLALGIGLVLEAYIGVLAAMVFFITDVILYLYLRTQNLVPVERCSTRADFIYRVSIVWVGLCGMVAGAAWIFSVERAKLSQLAPGMRMVALYEKIWGNDWILVAATLFSIAILVIGGFFLVRRAAD